MILSSSLPGICLLCQTALVVAKPFPNAPEHRTIERRGKQGMIKAIESFRNNNKQLDDYEPVAIDTYIHIVTTTEDNQRNVTDDDLRRQMEALNDAYRPAKMSFGLRDVTRVDDPEWSVGKDEDAMYRSLHRGDRSALNLYILEDIFRADAGPNRIVRGESTYPDRSGDNGSQDDYVLVQSYTLPGRVNKGDPSKRNYGATAVHEVGHWLGLFHTFETAYGAELGDLVDDTPFETDTYIQLRFGEPFDDENGDRRGVCKSLEPGVPNNIGNFMNDAPDYCRFEFTPGQLLNVRRLWDYFRASSPGQQQQQPPNGDGEGEQPQAPNFFANRTPNEVPQAAQTVFLPPGSAPSSDPFLQTPANAVVPATTDLAVETPAGGALPPGYFRSGGGPDESLAAGGPAPTEVMNPQPPGRFPDPGATDFTIPYLSQIHTFQYFVTGAGRGPSAGIVVDPRPMTQIFQAPVGGAYPPPMTVSYTDMAAAGGPLATPFTGSVTVQSSYPDPAAAAAPTPTSSAHDGDDYYVPDSSDGFPSIYSNPKFAGKGGQAADPTTPGSSMATPTGDVEPTTQASPPPGGDGGSSSGSSSPSAGASSSGSYDSPTAGSGRNAVSLTLLTSVVGVAVYMIL